MGGVAIVMEEYTNVFKSGALVSNSELYNNSANNKDGGMVYDWGNAYVKNSLFESNDVTADGGGGWIYISAVFNSLYKYNSAGDEGGGLVYIVKNDGGAMAYICI